MANETSPNTWTTSAVLDFLKATNSASLTSAIINDLIVNDSDNRERRKLLWDEYNQDNLDIQTKEGNEGEPNNIIMNDFRGDIIDQKVGYSWGNPISYEIDPGEKSDAELEKNNQALQDFIKQNRLLSLDRKTAKYSSVCGTSSRLLYIDDKKIFRVMHVNPWEAIYIIDTTVDIVKYAMRYFEMTEVDADSGKSRDYFRVEWYDEDKVYYFNEIEDGKYEPDSDTAVEPHGFKSIPLIEFPNKDERKGDFEKVRNLIDAYDKLSSFSQDELEAFRNAYLVFKNQTIDADIMKKIREMGGIGLDDDADVAWLVKNVNDNFVENNFQRLKSNIYRFAKAVDMSDENFSGSGQSGESRKWKLKTLSDDALIKEASFSEATQDMFYVIAQRWLALDIDLFDLNLQFTPNIPADLQYHADVTTKLKGVVSERTRLSLLPFVDDVEEEMTLMEEEATANMERFQAGLEQNTSTEEDGDEDGQTQNQNPNTNQNQVEE